MRADFGSPRLSQDKCIIAKKRRERTRRFCVNCRNSIVGCLTPNDRAEGSPVGEQTRSTESAMSVDPVGRAGRPKCRGRSTEIAESVDRGTPSRSTETPKSVDQNRQGSRVIARRRSRYRYDDIRHRCWRLRFPLFAKSGKSYGPIIRIRARSHCLRPDVQSFRKSTLFNAQRHRTESRTSGSALSHQRLSQVTPATRRGRTSNSEKLHQ